MMKRVSIESVLHTNLRNLINNYGKWAIYGTGDGAEMVWVALEELELCERVYYVVDKDTSKGNSRFHDFIVSKFENIIDEINVVIIGAAVNHRKICLRIISALNSSSISGVTVIDPFVRQSSLEEKAQYVDFINRSQESDSFVYISNNYYKGTDEDTKVITWYLPQFHHIEINDEYYGRGFTEWTNTSRTFPQFVGHYQPHIPYDVGYYDLMNQDVLKRQIELAKMYGIYGFGFFYYWFSGKKIMEKPIQLLLANKDLDIPFCLHWATDHWSTSWYGEDMGIIIEQKIPDPQQFWKDIYPYFIDERYIKIGGKPVFIIYKCKTFEIIEFKMFIDSLRSIAKENGFPDLYVMISTGDGSFTDAQKWGGDALVEYQPWRIYKSKSVKGYLPDGYINPEFIGQVIDIGSAIRNRDYMCDYSEKKYFRSAMTSWDNTARKCRNGAIIMEGNSPQLMKQWLLDIIMESKRIHSQEENYVFLSSWNEWAEGSHLEPDYKYGYAWLDAVRSALEMSRM